MLALLGISSLLALAAALVLGIRLLRLAARTRGVPEFAMGASFLLGGFLGFLLILVGNPAAGLAISADLAETLFRLGMSLLGLGVCFTYLFVWKTFHPSSARARALAVTAAVCILGSSWAVWSGPVETALASSLHLFGEAVRLGGIALGLRRGADLLLRHATPACTRTGGLGGDEPIPALGDRDGGRGHCLSDRRVHDPLRDGVS
jgi:hypothetical protein